MFTTYSLGVEVENTIELQDLVVDHYSRVLAGHPAGQLLLNVNGRAGMGSIETILSTSAAVNHMAREAGVTRMPILRVAPTCIGSIDIRGRTMHGMFRIPIPTSNFYIPLNADDRQSLQEELRDVGYLFLDARGMVGSTLWLWVDRRCRDLGRGLEPFGGMNVVMFRNTL
jgi:PIF1-like helicase